MRHKYETQAIVLSRAPLGEANTLLTLLTRELGLVRVRAQGLRKSGAKLAAALSTFAESDVVLLRGAEGWRLSGAVLQERWFTKLSRSARERAARISALLLRLVSGEVADERLFEAFQKLCLTLAEAPEIEHDAAEILAALTILAALGLDAGALPLSPASIKEARSTYVARVNRGIAASGLY